MRSRGYPVFWTVIPALITIACLLGLGLPDNMPANEFVGLGLGPDNGESEFLGLGLSPNFDAGT